MSAEEQAPALRRWRQPDPTLPLASAEVRVLDALTENSNELGTVSTGVITLVRLSGAGSYGTVRNALAWLVARGAIERVRVGTPPHRPSIWRVLRTVDELAAEVGVYADVVL